MDRQYYQQYYNLERTNWWFVVRSSLIKQCLQINIKPKDNRHILNIGVATGATSIMLEHFGKVVSSEYDSETCLFLKEELGMDVIEASATDLPFANGTFDWVCAFDVIEHIEDDARAVEEMIRVCKPGGFVAITVPADMALWSAHDVINHHFRRYNKKEIKNLFQGKHIVDIYSGYFNTVLYPLIWMARKFNNIFVKNKIPTSDFDKNIPGWMNKVFYFLFSLEKLWFGRLRIPFGVSIMFLGKKDGRGDKSGKGLEMKLRKEAQINHK